MTGSAETTPRAVRKDDPTWIDQGHGTTYAVLRFDPDDGLTTLTRFAAGSIGAWHTHPGGEELYVVKGELTVGTERLGPGDYLHTPPGAGHRVEAHSDVLLFVRLPKLPIYDAEEETRR